MRSARSDLPSARMLCLRVRTPATRLNWKIQPLPGRWNGCDESRTRRPRSRTDSRGTRRPRSTRPSRSPPSKSPAFVAATPRHAAVGEQRDLDGHGPYIRCDAPNGRSSGNRNSRLPTSMRLPTSRSNAGQSLAAVGTHSATERVDVVAANETRVADEEREQPRRPRRRSRTGRSA